MTQRQLIGRTITVVAVVILAGVMIWFVRETAEILVLLLVSAVIATGCAPLVGACGAVADPGKSPPPPGGGYRRALLSEVRLANSFRWWA